MQHTVLQKATPTQEMLRCISECEECHDVCRNTVSHCLDMGGKHAEQYHIWMLLDCAEICMTSARFMMHGSPLHAVTCRACAEICDRCADDCDSFRDDMMKACADVCRRCAASCRSMAAMSR